MINQGVPTEREAAREAVTELIAKLQVGQTFGMADYGVVGDAMGVLSVFTEELRKIKEAG